MRSNSITNLLGIDIPIVQGPFGGGLSSVALTATVSNLGGLGSFGAHYMSGDEIEDLCDRIRGETERPFAINLWVSDRDEAMSALDEQSFAAAAHRLDGLYQQHGVEAPQWPGDESSQFEKQVEAVLRARPKVFSFVFGIPSGEILAECRKAGIVTIGAATTPEEALAVQEAGVDVVLATGFEAGGHRPQFLKPAEESYVGTFALATTVRQRVSIPMILGGGIANARGVAAAFALGADAVQVGTAFLACDESGASQAHREVLGREVNESTRLSRAFTGRVARFLPNELLDSFGTTGEGALPFPAQSWLTRPLRAADNPDMTALYASQAAELVRRKPAAQLMKELVAGLPEAE